MQINPFNTDKVVMYIKDRPGNISDADVVICEQIHSGKVAEVFVKDKGKRVKNCDGLVTDERGVCLEVRTADCLPILIFDPVNIVIGAVHAGWRGTFNNITTNAVTLLYNSVTCRPKDLQIFIGPCIDKDNYLVRKDVYQMFKNAYPDYLGFVSEDQWKFDLVGINVKKLVDVGVNPDNIHLSGISTFNNKAYGSYRRDGVAHNFVSGIMIK